MKKYVFFAPNIHFIGGGQLYTSGKATYLESQGWQVYIFFAGEPNGLSEIPSLNKYIAGCGFRDLNRISYAVDDRLREQTLERMIDILRIDETVQNEIIIESHICIYASWAELLAEKIHARHFFVAIEESFRGHYPPYESMYEDNLDFFYFKYKRNELLLQSPEALQRLFQGYRNVKDVHLNIPPGVLLVHEQAPIQDVENSKIDRIERGDLNICYIGRTDKPYVPAIFKGVADFAKKNLDKQIRFVIVGKFLQNQLFEQMKRIFVNLANIKIHCVGNLVPIPRSLFDKVDVVIAGAQTAIFSAYEKPLVITTHTDSDLTPGVLFIDTVNPWCDNSSPKISYADALENVLVKKKYKDLKPVLPKRFPAEWHYKNALEIQLTQSTEPLEYFTKKFKSCEDSRDWFAIFPYHVVQFGAKIVLYGSGQILIDYLRQIRKNHFCKIVAVVSDNYEDYDDSVMPPESLSSLEYDGIVIAEFPNQTRLRKIMENIVRITGKKNYAYSFQDVLTL